MATTLTYSVADFQPFTKIISADMNAKLTDIRSRLNWAGGTDATTGLGDDNIQSAAVTGGGLTRATKLKAGTPSHVVINDGAGAMSSEATLALARGGLAFAPSLVGNAGKAVVVNDAETALNLAAPATAQLTQSLSGDISSLTAGEAITANDAVCLALAQDATTANIYKVFRCGDSLADRRQNFIGFAVAGATVVAHTLTWTNSAALVTSNVITYSINSRSYSTTFATDNNTTLAAIATQIATDPDIQSAALVSAGANDRVINVTGKGGLQINITGAVVTGGASQATVTIATTQAPSGQNVRIRNFGLLSGFTSLAVGARYYLSSSTGAITTAPTSNDPVFVGQALDTTQLFVNKNALNYQFSTPSIFVRSHGSSKASSTTFYDAGTQDVEHYNFTSWLAGTSSAAGARSASGTGSFGYNNAHYQLDGLNTGGTPTLLFQSYNKSAWGTLTSRSTGLRDGAVNSFNGFLYATGGSTSSGSGGSNVSTVSKWNGASWSAGTALATAVEQHGGFVQGSLFHLVGGSNSGAINTHQTISTADVNSTATVYPASAVTGGSAPSGSNGLAITTNSTNSYVWSGSWTSALTVPFITGPSASLICGGAGYSSSVALTVINGGMPTSASNTNATGHFSGSAWSSGTASTNSRTSGVGSVI